MKEYGVKTQNLIIDKIINKVETLSKVANNKSYEPTDYERERFGYLVRLVNGMNEWF